MSIIWIDISDRKNRFFASEDLAEVSSLNAVRLLFDKMCENILGKGHAKSFDLIMFEVAFFEGGLTIAVGKLDGWRKGLIDGCSIRVKEISDFETLLDCDDPESTEVARGTILELANKLDDLIHESKELLQKYCDPHGFDVIVWDFEDKEVLRARRFDSDFSSKDWILKNHT